MPRKSRKKNVEPATVADWKNCPIADVRMVDGIEVTTYCRIPLREAAARVFLDLERRAIARKAAKAAAAAATPPTETD